MIKKGGMIYVPPNILDEADLIMRSKNITSRSDALREIVEYSRVGREVEQILKLNFNIFKRRVK